MMNLQALNLIGKDTRYQRPYTSCIPSPTRWARPSWIQNVEDPTNITHDSSGIVYVQYHINWQIEE